jgi:hypothetical protein
MEYFSVGEKFGGRMKDLIGDTTPRHTLRVSLSRRGAPFVQEKLTL